MHEKVRSALQNLPEADYRLWAHSDLGTPVRSAADFAAAMKVDAAQVAKSVLVVGPARSDRHAVVSLSSRRRIELNRVALALGWKSSSLADRQEVVRILDYPPGGVSPIGLSGIPVLLDSELLEFEMVFVGAGEVGQDIEIRTSSLHRLLAPIIADVAV